MHALVLRAPVCPAALLPAVPFRPRWAVLAAVAGLVLSTGGCPRQPEKLTTLPVLTTDDPRAEADMRAARDAEEQGRVEEARAGYEAFLDEHPEDPLAPIAELGLGRILLAEGEVAQARERLERVADHSDPAVAERARFYLGVAQHLAGEHALALETLTPYVGKTVDPEDTALLLRTIGAAAIHVGDRVRAVEAYDRLAGDAAPEEARVEAEERIAAIVEQSAEPADIRALYELLPHDGVAWPRVATRAAREAYAAGETARAKEILAALEDEGIPLDHELQEMAVRIERTGKADPRIVGAILPLSGRAKEVGHDALRGLMLAANAPHEGPIDRDDAKIVFRDDAGDAERAAEAVEDLVTLHQAIAIIGPAGAAGAKAAAERAQELGVPLIALSPAEDLTAAGPMVFRLFFTPDTEARELVAAARDRGARRFAVLHSDNAFGKRMRAAFDRQVREQGGELVADVSYEPGTTSFAQPVRELARARFDALFLPDSSETIQLVAPALASAGLWRGEKGGRASRRSVRILLPSVGHSNELLRESGRYLQGALVSIPFDASSAAGRAFAERFHMRFGSKPDVFAAYAYDAFQLLRAGTRAGAATREDLADHLQSTDGARTTVGASSGLNEAREPLRGTRVYEVDGADLARVR
ncbi:MAG: ABC transporter substrate-binding protein [Myxococcota bacterium]